MKTIQKTALIFTKYKPKSGMKEAMNEGEKLLLLVRRSGKQNKDVAELLDIKPTSLSRIFRSETLTSKVKRKAAEVFGVEEGFFSDPDAPLPAPPPTVAEPAPKYQSAPVRTDAELLAENARLQAENEALRAEVLDLLRDLRKAGKIGPETKDYFLSH
jgi:transcriptional regulator with XRE-family HTH domain